MSLTERFAEEPPASCKVRAILEALPRDDSEAVNKALSNPRWSSIRIAQILTAEGHPVGRSTVQAHRNLTCQCCR
jgi:hypothetical protein